MISKLFWTLKLTFLSKKLLTFTKIKELYKYDKYCKEITKRAEGMQNNLNNFDKDIQKEKDNSRNL